MSFGQNLESSMDSMEETRFKKRYSSLILRLSKKLHFTYTELECLFLIYYKIAKDGGDKGTTTIKDSVTKVQFRDVLHCAFDMTDDILMDRIFYVLDKGPGSVITMEIWATAFSMWLRGTLEEKLDYCFQVYDLVGDGMIGRDTMFHLLRTSLKSQGGDEDAEESVKDMLEVLTKKMDLDRDGRISYNDYRQTVLKQPLMLEVMGQCLPSRPAVYAFVLTFTPNIGKM